MLLPILFYLIFHLGLSESKERPDFDWCFDKTQNRSLFDDPNNHAFFSHRTDFLGYEPKRIYVTHAGCLHYCGEGFTFWPANETGLRMGCFILPLIVLAAAFSFKPHLGIGNQIFTTIHLLGNPIHSLWSILVRQEAARRNYAFAMETVPSAPREVAAILTVYDQWWQDARTHFGDKLHQRYLQSIQEEAVNGVGSVTYFEMENEHQHDSPYQQWWQRLLPWIKHPKWDESWQVHVPGDERSRRHSVSDIGLLSPAEILHIRRTARVLAANRTSKFIQTWASIGLFIVSVAVGYLRAIWHYEHRKNSQTAHSIAVVLLFSFFIFAVYVNGHVGNFHNQRVMQTTLNELRECSKSLGELFPNPQLQDGMSRTFQKFSDSYEMTDTYNGLINSWRPKVFLKEHDLHDRGLWTLLLPYSICVTLTSWVAAFTISYRTPTIGFGCRSFTWTVILAAWITNAALFSVIASSTRKLKTIWICSYICDIPVALGIVGAILMVQIGVMNSCWCRAGLTSSPLDPMDIGPPTDRMRRDGTILWLCVAVIDIALIFLGIFLAGLDGENGRLLYVRSSAEAMAEQRGIHLEKTRLQDIGDIREYNGIAPDGRRTGGFLCRQAHQQTQTNTSAKL